MESAFAVTPPATVDAPGRPRVGFWRGELKAGRQGLDRAFLAKPDTARLLRDHARLVDRVVGGVWAESTMPDDFALLAVGGYGRRELYPHSDVDLLILLAQKEDAAGAACVERFFAALWDVGLELAHA